MKSEINHIRRWRYYQEQKREKQRRAAVRAQEHVLHVPPGVYGLEPGERRLITDSRGNTYPVVADATPIHRRRTR